MSESTATIGRADTVRCGESAYGAVAGLAIDGTGVASGVRTAVEACSFEVQSVGPVLVVRSEGEDAVESVIRKRDRLSRELSALGTAAVYVLSSRELLPVIPLDGEEAET